MDSKIYLNVIKTLTPTYIHVLSCWSEGDTTMSNLMILERVLSICLRDDILEKNPYYEDTENKLHTHAHYGPGETVDFLEFHAWLVTYEQIMRDEGLIGNTGTGEDEADRESVFIDPFLTPFVHKKGAEISVEPFDESEDVEVDGADEESDEFDRDESDSGDDSEGEYGGTEPPSEHPETEEQSVGVSETPLPDEEDVLDDETDDDGPPLGPPEPEPVECKCPGCFDIFILDESVCKKSVDGEWYCVNCSRKIDEEEDDELDEPLVQDESDILIIKPEDDEVGGEQDEELKASGETRDPQDLFSYIVGEKDEKNITPHIPATLRVVEDETDDAVPIKDGVVE